MSEEIEVRVGEGVRLVDWNFSTHRLCLALNVLFNRGFYGMYICLLIKGNQNNNLHSHLLVNQLLYLGLGIGVQVAVSLELLLHLLQQLLLFPLVDSALGLLFGFLRLCLMNKFFAMLSYSEFYHSSTDFVIVLLLPLFGTLEGFVLLSHITVLEHSWHLLNIIISTWNTSDSLHEHSLTIWRGFFIIPQRLRRRGQ